MKTSSQVLLLIVFVLSSCSHTQNKSRIIASNETKGNETGNREDGPHTLECVDQEKDLKISVSNLDETAMSPSIIDIKVFKNGDEKKFSRSEATYTGELALSLHPSEVQPKRELRFIISNYSKNLENAEILNSVWRLKIGVDGSASMILGGSSILGVPEYKINCK